MPVNRHFPNKPPLATAGLETNLMTKLSAADTEKFLALCKRQNLSRSAMLRKIVLKAMKEIDG